MQNKQAAAAVTAVESKPSTSSPEVLPGQDHPNYLYTALSTPLDTEASLQWRLNKISAPQAWGISTGNSSLTVAVIDTGFDFSHEGLTNNWWSNAGEMGATNVSGSSPNCLTRGLAQDKSCNNYDNDSDGYPSDWRGWDFVNNDNDPSVGTTDPASQSAFHGTYVANLIGASDNNGPQVAGVNWHAKIMPLQALSDDGAGYTDQIANAVDYAVAHGAKVINLSLGSTFDDAYLHSRIDAAISAGVVVVAAAGNSGGGLTYPAAYPEVIAVGASDASDNRASFSSYGANLDLVAPGTGGICSAYWTPADPVNGYSCTGQGTSFSAPQVSGAAALILSVNPTATPAQVVQYLEQGADKPPAMNGANFTQQLGYGRLDVYGALLAATQAATPISASLSSSPAVTTTCSAPGPTCTLRLVGPSNQVVILPAALVDRFGQATVQLNTAALGLTAGAWQMQVQSSNGTILGYGQNTINISP